MKKIISLAASAVVTVAVVSSPAAYAVTSSANSQLTQQITAGVLSTDFRDSTNTLVTNPVFAMSTTAASTTAQTSTGLFGTNAQRVSVDNPGGANAGWTLTLNATTPGTGAWTSGSNNYPYNGTGVTGQLTVNPAASTLTVNQGAASNVTKGAQAAFTGTTPVTLLTATAAASQIWNGYLTGISLSQVIPAGQALGSYTLNMTQTVTSS